MIVDGTFSEFDTDEMPSDLRLNLFYQHGGQTLSYSAAVQTGLKHFGNESGYIAFQTKFGYPFVLGDPVCSRSQLEIILDAFVKKFPKAAFCQISEDVAGILNARRYWVNQMGIDTRLDLQAYDFNGKEKERFRYATNWLSRRDFIVRELDFDARNQDLTRRLGDQWRNTRSVKQETAFINRPLEFKFQPRMRRFFLLNSDKEPVAFVFFDPICRNEETIGYVTAFKRRGPTAPSLAEQGICKVAIENFKSEGREIVKLGFSPFAMIEDQKFRYNPIMKRSFRYFYGAKWVNRWFYNLKGHASFKDKFRGEVENVYFATPSFVNDLRLVALFRLCKIL